MGVRFHMKAIPAIFLAIGILGCTQAQDITGASCVPEGVPGTVTLKREAYLYKFDGEPQISLWDARYRYGKADSTGQMQIYSPEPLKVLPIGTQITIQRVRRVTGFDGPWDAIELSGLVRIDEEYSFKYVWGVSNKIHSAPWEEAVYRPSDIDRVVDCAK